MDKKIIFALLIICLLLTGCNEKKNETKENTNNKTQEINKQDNSNKNNVNELKDNNKEEKKSQKENTKEIKIEDYTGMNYLEVKAKLELKGLIVVIEKTDSIDDMFTENMIARQSIHPDVTLNEGDTITLYIPDIEKKYPDFTDGTYSLSDIQSFCNKYGIVLKTEDDPNAEKGKITHQSKEVGSTIIHNEVFTIKLGAK